MKILHKFFAPKRILNQTIMDSDNNWKNQLEKYQNKYNIQLPKNHLRKTGKLLYSYFLKKYIEDLFLSKEEIEQLDKISVTFGLNFNDLKTIKNSLNYKAVNELSKIKYSDGVISDQKLTEIKEFAKYLDLPLQQIEKINTNNALNIFKVAMNDALSDRRLTAEEEEQLKNLQKSLGLDDYSISTLPDYKALPYYKLLYEIENGILPEIYSSIVLQKGEICHIETEASLLISKVVTTGYSAGSRGVSVRIAKGVSYRVGSSRAHAIKEEVTFKYPGSLVVTNKRIVFKANQKGFVIPLKNLISYDVYSDGIGLQKGMQNYLLQFNQKNGELLGVLLSAVTNNLND